MSISMQEIIAENSRWITGSQALVEGILRLPEQMREISTILDITGLGEVVETRLVNARISVEGTANFCVLYLDREGNFASFNSECNFMHSIDMPGCTPEMQILALAEASDISFNLVDSNAISVRAVLDIDIYAVANCKYEVLDTASSGKYTRIKCDDAVLPLVTCARNFRAYVKSELRVPQSMPAVKRVLSENGYAVTKNVVVEQGKAVIEGELRVFIVYESTDKNAPLQYFNETLPYGEIVNDERIRQDASLFVVASLERLGVESDEGNADILEVSGVVNHFLICRGQKQIEYILDLYDEENETDLSAQTIDISYVRAFESQKKIVRLSAAIPDTSPEVSRVLYTCAYPKVTSVSADKDRVMLAGTIGILLCYTTTDAGPKSVRMVIPFETEVAYPGMESGEKLWAKCHAEYALAEGSGRELEIKCCLDICLWELENDEVNAVSDVQFRPVEGDKQSGVVVYYTNGQETLWDIAKKFKVKKDVLGDITDNAKIEKGKRLILIKR